MWLRSRLAAAQNSIAKSRSLTASSEFSLTVSKPSSAATRPRSIGNVVPAIAPLPSGSTLVRRRQSENRSRSRISISNHASRWWPNVTGWAAWRCVNPGMMVAVWRDARSTIACPTSVHSATMPRSSSIMNRRTSVATWSLRDRARVQLLSGVTNQRRQPRFDIHVHVFQRHRPVELPGLDFGQHLLQPVDDRVALCFRQDALSGEHVGVRDGPPDIVTIEALVERHRRGKRFDERVSRLAEAPTPEFLVAVCCSCQSPRSGARSIPARACPRPLSSPTMRVPHAVGILKPRR